MRTETTFDGTDAAVLKVAVHPPNAIIQRTPTSRRFTPTQIAVITLISREAAPLQTAEIRRRGRLTTIQARSACVRLLEAGYLERRLRMVPVTVGERTIRRPRAFWSLTGIAFTAISELALENMPRA